MPGRDHNQDDAGDRVVADVGRDAQPIPQPGHRDHRRDRQQEERLSQLPGLPRGQAAMVPDPGERPADPPPAVPQVRPDHRDEDQPDDGVDPDGQRLEDHRGDADRE
jgi:hypothetical protein